MGTMLHAQACEESLVVAHLLKFGKKDNSLRRST